MQKEPWQSMEFKNELTFLKVSISVPYNPFFKAWSHFNFLMFWDTGFWIFVIFIKISNKKDSKNVSLCESSRNDWVKLHNSDLFHRIKFFEMHLYKGTLSDTKKKTEASKKEWKIHHI